MTKMELPQLLLGLARQVLGLTAGTALWVLEWLPDAVRARADDYPVPRDPLAA